MLEGAITEPSSLWGQGATAKLLSLVVVHRIDVWAEEEGLRVLGQAGFRHGLGGGGEH